MRRIVFSRLIGLTALSGCANPVEQTRTVDHRSTIVVKNAPSDSVLYVDGLSMGNASQYVDQALVLEPGTHQVQIRQGGAVIHAEKIFVSGTGTKTITVNGSGVR